MMVITMTKGNIAINRLLNSSFMTLFPRCQSEERT